MIFLSGWVHCDPHPGNVFVRPVNPSWFRKIVSRFVPGMSAGNFQIVLLDHGLYRSIPRDSRILYAKLWTSVIRRDEESLLECTRKLFGGRLKDQNEDGRVDYHRLLASMMTGRSWGGVLSVYHFDLILGNCHSFRGGENGHPDECVFESFFYGYSRHSCQFAS